MIDGISVPACVDSTKVTYTLVSNSISIFTLKFQNWYLSERRCSIILEAIHEFRVIAFEVRRSGGIEVAQS